MAESVVSYVVGNLGNLLTQEATLLGGVRGQIERFQTELKRMMCFLKDADQRQNENELVKEWIREIRELAYDTEDLIEGFFFEIVSRRRKGLKNKIKRYCTILGEWRKFHQLGTKVEEMNRRIVDITTGLQTYGIRFNQEGEDSASSVRQRELRRTYSHEIEGDVVDIDTNIEFLVRQLVQGDEPIVSICGMGGLGKTTLAKQIYFHDEVRRHFDYFAWVCVSQKFQTRKVWEDILIKFLSPTKEGREVFSSMIDEEIAKKLYQLQGEKRCLLVLDDIWSIEAWDVLTPAFPIGLTTGSKIIMTTRNKALGFHVNARIMEPRCLTEEESWELLQKKSFARKNYTGFLISSELEGLGRELAKRCGGLPLAVTLLGGLLASKDSFEEWRHVHENLNFFSKGHEQFFGVHEILSLSYNDLPYQLKPCFLHLCHFQEEEEIHVNRLCRCWVAEGFIPPIETTKETREDIAESYLDGLIDRCMVQVRLIKANGNIKTCGIHNLMRELSLSLAREEIFFEVVVQDVNRSAVSSKVYRLAVHGDGYDPQAMSSDTLRSLTVFGKREPGYSRCLIPTLSCFKLLRQLTLYGCLDESANLTEIGSLIHLRYLEIAENFSIILPSSIGNLRYLQTLHLTFNYGISLTLPNIFWKLEQLRHLILDSSIMQRKCKKLLKLGNSRNVQTLKIIDTCVFDVNELLKFTNLKQLGIRCKEGFEEVKVVFEPSRSFNNLSFLFLQIGGAVIEETDLKRVFVCCPHLCKLSLRGEIRKLPEHHHFPSNLTKIILGGSKLEEDPLATLEQLPNLNFLRLINVTTAEKLVCSSKGFPCLKILQLYQFVNCVEWQVDEEAMPNLTNINMVHFPNLLMLPDGLRFITTLHELKIGNMSGALIKRLSDVTPEGGGEDLYKFQHVPSVIIY